MFSGIVLSTSQILYIDGTLTIETLTNGRYLAVAEGGTLNITGNAYLTGSGNYEYMFFKNCGTIDIGGQLIINTSTGKCPLLYYIAGSTGTIKVGGVVNNDKEKAFSLCGNHETPISWEIGEQGIVSGGGKGFIQWGTDNGEVTLKASTNFTMAAALCPKTSMKLDTGDGWTITQNGRLAGSGTFTIAGSGTFIGNCSYNSTYTTSGGVAVTNTATLAVNPGKGLTSGTITMNGGTTYKVNASGTNTLYGVLTLADGAKLAFNFTDVDIAPVLNKNDKTLTVSDNPVTVTVTGDIKPKLNAYKYTLTTGGGFTGKTLTLGDGSAKWAKKLAVDDDGNIVLTAIGSGLMFFFR